MSAITLVNAQSISTATLKNQEQQLLAKIKRFKKEDPKGNMAQIQILEHKYKALLQQQQQQTQTVTPQQNQNANVKDNGIGHDDVAKTRNLHLAAQPHLGANINIKA